LLALFCFTCCLLYLPALPYSALPTLLYLALITLLYCFYFAICLSISLPTCLIFLLPTNPPLLAFFVRCLFSFFWVNLLSETISSRKRTRTSRRCLGFISLSLRYSYSFLTRLGERGSIGYYTLYRRRVSTLLLQRVEPIRRYSLLYSLVGG
jgi:hypothetical protein